ncbi:methyltransferase [Cellvibrio sp. OA-2007]|uniref:methyltransferase n=1 Tax=Cellvibrio sp. OA-2007 TaxID=529823 RepID=UPI000786759D|nr:methyltransferase [Cellvibrio sp. OA-2007]
MNDLPLNWITQVLTNTRAESDARFLWCTDENALNTLPAALHQEQLLVLTNRWDVAEQAKTRGFTTEFNDFDCSAITDNSLDKIFYRISKEKPIVHHLLNQAWRCLKPGGQLLLAGYKNEGTKTYIEKIAKLMGCGKNSEKNGPVYSAVLSKYTEYDSTQLLDDNDYRQPRAIAQDSNLILLSKPGLFGWNKVDAGSALLIEQLKHLSPPATPFTCCVDLGCGYGYLTMAAAKLDICQNISHWVLTDNNAAALQLAQQNLLNNQLAGEVVAADAGKGIHTKADLLLCNPPFHQGFGIDGDLTDKFLHSAKHLLAPHGVALFVVNQFIPLERKAAPLFSQIKLVLDNGSFKVIQLGL